MGGYDKQYVIEGDLFGQPYPEFIEFVQRLEGKGHALDIGCGQGRDALMLAAYGFQVTGIDASEVGVRQMLAQADVKQLAVTGWVGDFFTFAFPETYDLIVFDAVLHFANDRAKEVALLHRAMVHTKPNGHVVIFIHKSRTKERHLQEALQVQTVAWETVEERYIDYVYHEEQSGFQSAFQIQMVVLRKKIGLE